MLLIMIQLELICVCVLKCTLAYTEDYNKIYQTLTEATSRWWD